MFELNQYVYCSLIACGLLIFWEALSVYLQARRVRKECQ